MNEVESLVHDLVVEVSDELCRAAVARATADFGHTTHKDARELKRMWQREADIASFKRLHLVHWSTLWNIRRLLFDADPTSEISTLPYKGPPFTPLAVVAGMSAAGVLVTGHPTFATNADLMSGVSFRSGSTVKRLNINKYPVTGRLIPAAEHRHGRTTSCSAQTR